MKIYYIRHNEESLGPYSKDELRLVGVYQNDFVWKGGLGQWTQAKDLTELQDILITSHSAFEGGTISEKKSFPWRMLLNWKKSVITKLFRINFLPKE